MTAERLRTLDPDELAAAIRATPPEWPATPPLERIVVERIRESERQPLGRPRLSLPSRRRTVLILAAAVLLLAAAAVAASLVVRIGAESVQLLPGPPGVLPSNVLNPEMLGDPRSLDDARSEVGFEPLLPARLGAPDGIWVGSTPSDASDPGRSRLVLAWFSTPEMPALDHLPWGAVMIEFSGRAELAAKTVFEETGGGIRTLDVGGHRGVWVTGEHALKLASLAGGEPLSLRVTGNVLLWQRGDVTLRLETGLDLPAALEIANSVP